jgi:hypothetical protein
LAIEFVVFDVALVVTVADFEVPDPGVDPALGVEFDGVEFGVEFTESSDLRFESRFESSESSEPRRVLEGAVPTTTVPDPPTLFGAEFGAEFGEELGALLGLLLTELSSLPRLEPPRPLSADAGPMSSNVLAAIPTVIAAEIRRFLLARRAAEFEVEFGVKSMKCSSVGVSVLSHTTTFEPSKSRRRYDLRRTPRWNLA